MSIITPLKIAYNLQVKEHTMRAVAEHLELVRRITFYFDDRVVAEKNIEPGDFLTDDDCISEIVRNYCRNAQGVYADLFSRHSDKVQLVSKTLDFSIENYGLIMLAHVTVEKGRYFITVESGDGVDTFSCTFKAENFSEVLEKVRIFTNTLEGVSNSFSSHINELSSDKVEEWIRWK